jgi:hypothetical protein
MEKLHKEDLHELTFLYLNAVTLKTAVLCDVEPYSLVERIQGLR